MAPTPYILPREKRESAILVGNGTVGPFGPSLYKIFDTADVAVFAKALGETVYTDVTAGCTIAKVNPAAAYDYFTVTFGAAVPATTSWYHQARRTAERSVAVTKAGTINSLELEKELSKQASAQSELRRDVDRAVRVMLGTDPVTIIPGVDGELVKFEDGNAVGSGENVDTIMGSTAAAAASAAAAAASATGAGNSATAAAASAASAASDAGILASLVAGFGAIWNTILQTTTYAAAWLSLGITGYRGTRAGIKALTGVTAGQVVFLTESGRFGLFEIKAGVQPYADPMEGCYFPLDSGGFYAERVNKHPVDVRWFGATPNVGADQAPAIMAAYNLLVLMSGTTECRAGDIEARGGYYTIGSSLAFLVPVGFYVPNMLNYTPAAGSALIISPTAPIANRNTGYNIDVGGLRAVNGNVAAPTGVNMAGCSAVEIRNVQFSKIKIGRIIAFTKYGFWGNQTNDVYSGQHCQDNDIWLGDVAYCGRGIHVESVSAALGAFQVNDVHVQNAFGNWQNFRVGGAGDNNTNNNFFTFNAMDADTGGGAGFVRGLYNDFKFGYANGTIAFEAGSAYNRAYAQVGAAQVTFTDAGTRNELTNAVEGRLTPQWWQTINNTVTAPLINLVSTLNTTSYAEVLALRRRKAAGAANDGGVGIGAYFNNDVGAEVLGGRIRTDMPSVASAGSNYNMRWLFDTIVGGTLAQRLAIWLGLTVGAPAGGDKGIGTINIEGSYYIAGTKVVGAQATGWTAGTGTANKGAFAAYAGAVMSAAYTQAEAQATNNAARDASQRIKAIEDALRTHGLIN